MIHRLDRAFFTRPAPVVARELVGTRLVRLYEDIRLSGRIVETEAYSGWDDQASHASKGMTKRNSVMFGLPGCAYVYFIYGRYWMLNVVAKECDVDYGAAVLIRAIEPLEGIPQMAALRNAPGISRIARGPACLSMALVITGTMDGLDICSEDSSIFIESLGLFEGEEIASGPRVGINYASTEWREKPWRFIIAGCDWVSGVR